MPGGVGPAGGKATPQAQARPGAARPAEPEAGRHTRLSAPEDQPQSPEHLLQEALRRALRKPAGRLLVVLHLAALAPPAPHAHHRRVARSVLEEAAQLHDGEVHSLGNDDVVLLCRLPEQGDPSLLRTALRHLFQAETVTPEALVSLWHLERDGAAVQQYLDRCLATAASHGTAPPQTLAQMLGGLSYLAKPAATGAAPLPAGGSIGQIELVLRRQTAIRLDPSDPSHASDGLPKARPRPLFRELFISFPALERRIATVRQARGDAFLLRHLATELDMLVLAALRGALPQAAGLRPHAGEEAVPLHLNLTIGALLSESFRRLAETGLQARIEMQMIDIAADPAGFAAARALLERHHLPLVLDGISHVSLRLMRPAALRPDFVKLEWSPRLAMKPRPGAISEDMPDEWQRIHACLEGMTEDKIILDRTDSDEALRWGLSHGLRNFQGSTPDLLQATMRLGTCAAGRDCTLRQCAARAEAADAATRGECGNHMMLDHGPPAALLARLTGKS